MRPTRPGPVVPRYYTPLARQARILRLGAKRPVTGRPASRTTGSPDGELRMSHSVLIVDDSKLVTDIVKMRLELHGYRVRTAHSGADALIKIQTVAPDVVV